MGFLIFQFRIFHPFVGVPCLFSGFVSGSTRARCGPSASAIPWTTWRSSPLDEGSPEDLAFFFEDKPKSPNNQKILGFASKRGCRWTHTLVILSQPCTLGGDSFDPSLLVPKTAYYLLCRESSFIMKALNDRGHSVCNMVMWVEGGRLSI